MSAIVNGFYGLGKFWKTTSVRSDLVFLKELRENVKFKAVIDWRNQWNRTLRLTSTLKKDIKRRNTGPDKDAISLIVPRRLV